MGNFEESFGSDGGEYENIEFNDPAEAWPPKFLLMACTEGSGEIPSLHDATEVLNSFFPSVDSGDIDTMYSSVVDVHASCAGSDEAWDHVWEKFAGQLGSYSMSENFELLTIVVRLLYVFKMSEDMEAVNENITYRLSNCERHMLLSKRDFLQILKEEAEISGYNDHVDNQG